MHRLLLVEDDALTIRLYQKALQQEDFVIDTAENGEEGLEKLKKNKPTLILLDIMMPKMDGIELLQELKSNPDTKDIPVIVLTNLSGSKDAENALEIGAVKFIVKSKTRPNEVLEIVKSIIAAYTRDEIPPPE